MSPPTTQAAKIHPDEGRYPASRPEVVKMPAPIMLATTRLVAVSPPIWRFKEEASGDRGMGRFRSGDRNNLGVPISYAGNAPRFANRTVSKVKPPFALSLSKGFTPLLIIPCFDRSVLSLTKDST